MSSATAKTALQGGSALARSEGGYSADNIGLFSTTVMYPACKAIICLSLLWNAVL